MLKSFIAILCGLFTLTCIAQELSTYKPLAQDFLSDLSKNPNQSSSGFKSFMSKSGLEFALSQGGNLPADPSEKEKTLNSTYASLEAEFANSVNSLKGHLDASVIDPQTAIIKSIHIGQFEVVKSNRSSGFGAPTPKDQEIHVELFSILVLVEDPKQQDNKALFKLSCLNTNGVYHVMSVEPVRSNFSTRQAIYNDLPSKLTKVLAEHSSKFSGLKANSIADGVFNSSIQLSPEGKTLLISRGSFVPDYKVEAVIADAIPEQDIAIVIDEVLAVLAIETTEKVTTSMAFTKEKVDYEISYQLNSYTNLAFDSALNKLVKNLYFYYTLKGDYSRKSVKAALVVGQNEDGTGKITLVLEG